jgi:ribosomal-protein-alanine N-acetyltransferase
MLRIGSAITVRQFHGDLDRILEIEKEGFGRRAWKADQFRPYAAQYPDLFLVAQVGSTIAAYSCTSTRGDRAELASIAVAKDYRNRGIGSAFLSMLIDKLKHMGFATLSLMVRRDNVAAIRFYRALGFRRIRTVPFYYEGGETAWRMRLELK